MYHQTSVIAMAGDRTLPVAGAQQMATLVRGTDTFWSRLECLAA